MNKLSKRGKVNACMANLNPALGSDVSFALLFASLKFKYNYIVSFRLIKCALAFGSPWSVVFV